MKILLAYPLACETVCMQYCGQKGIRPRQVPPLRGTNTQRCAHMGQKVSNWINGQNLFQESC